MSQQPSKRILSGIQSTGTPTLGNYLGAIKRWVATQDEADAVRYFFIPDLHTLSARQDAETFTRNTREAVAWLLAAGLDPKKVTIFVQSQVSAHAELNWILTNFVTMGELNRMTQFKDKSRKVGADGQVVSMFAYPVLMAADILLYDINEVPVGDDQTQHVELTRDIANRFNNLHAGTFVVPKAVLPEVGARIMNLQDPTSKMSKSDEDQSGNVLLSDDIDLVRKKIMRAITDSDPRIIESPDKPGVTNLLHILSAVTGENIKALEKRYEGAGYGQFKTEVADSVVAALEPMQKRFAELMANPAEIDAVLASGAEQADEYASKTLKKVKNQLGLL